MNTLSDYDLPKDVRIAYTQSLVLHIQSVYYAGKLLGLPGRQLRLHDESKWSKLEFEAYALWYHGEKDPRKYAYAWNHHVHNNSHHWQHWLFADGFTLDGAGMQGNRLEMPEHYALEMIADWMGAEMAYNNTWIMTKWLNDNFGWSKLHDNRVQLHDSTWNFVANVLSNQLDYIWTDYGWYHASELEVVKL